MAEVAIEKDSVEQSVEWEASGGEASVMNELMTGSAARSEQVLEEADMASRDSVTVGLGADSSEGR